MSRFNQLVADKLGKRYGKRWALRDCTLAVPQGSVCALVGPNGAGKSTLLHLAVGLAVPSSGSITTVGGDPRADAAFVLPQVGFVAQDRPLYRRLSVVEHCELAARLNRWWDGGWALSRLDRLGIDLRQQVGKLSGGQGAQLALVLALAKHPELILLDEPTASLDPLARREFLQVLMDAVASDGTTVVLSSHNVADLERVCDHVVILSHGRVQVADELDRFLGTHRLLVGPRAVPADLAHVGDIVLASESERQSTLLVRAGGPFYDLKWGHLYDARWDVREVGFEELVLGYLARPVSAGDGTRAGDAT